MESGSTSSNPIYLVVEHRTSESYQRMKAKISFLQAELDKLKSNYRDLEHRYGYEIQANIALCDLLRSKEIPFKPIFDHLNRNRP